MTRARQSPDRAAEVVGGSAAVRLWPALLPGAPWRLRRIRGIGHHAIVALPEQEQVLLGSLQLASASGDASALRRLLRQRVPALTGDLLCLGDRRGELRDDVVSRMGRGAS